MLYGRREAYTNAREILISFFSSLSEEILSEQKRIVTTYENIVSLQFLIQLLEGQ